MIEVGHIPVNRTKLLIHIILLISIGLVFLIGSFVLAERSRVNPLIWQGCGILLFLFAILAVGAKAKKRSDKKAGITFTKEGIIDTSSDIGVGLLKWKDIVDIDRSESLRMGLLIIQVKRQNEYIKKAKNSAIERVLKQNIRKFGTPIVIEASNLTCSLEELLDKVQGQWKK